LSKLDGILGARFALQPMPPDAILAILVNQLSSAAEKLVVVLDDYQFIENQEIHGFVNSLLDNLPPNIHLIISTRADPPLRLARLRAKDQLNEIKEKDLRFTLQEAEDFFNTVMGLSLTGEQVTELEARTEGWVTGLQLVGLSLKDREHPNELIETLAGTHRGCMGSRRKSWSSWTHPTCSSSHWTASASGTASIHSSPISCAIAWRPSSRTS
ncbi:MAG: hypothetical protein P8Z00_08070, partial [Anaerolineales bacterium]